MKIFISGITGFVGSRLAERLVQAHALSGCHRRIAPDGVAARAECVRLDLADDPRLVVDRLEALQPDLVVHCAALSRPADVARDPRAGRRVNVEAGHWIADWCRRRERPLIVFSSDTVYADATVEAAPAGGWREEDPLAPLSAYARSKAELEATVGAVFPPATLLRCSLVHGRGPVGGNSFTGWLEGRYAGPDPVPVFHDNRRHAIAACQVADAIEALLGDPPAGALNLGGADFADRATIARRWCERVGADPGRLRSIAQAEAGLADPVPLELPLNLDRLAARLGRPPEGLAAGLAREFPASTTTP